MITQAPTHRALSDQVMESIRGGTVASKLLFDIRGGHASPDALLDALRVVGDGERQRGFARALQKALEGRA